MGWLQSLSEISIPIHLPWGTINIVPECMGYRSAIALTGCAFVYGLDRGIGRKNIAKLLTISLALSIIFNALRIGIIVAVSYFNWEAAFGSWHNAYGFLTFSLGLWCMVAIADRMNDIGRH